MLNATGSASSRQNGIVARTHCVRVIALGASVRAPNALHSSSQSPATVNARSARARSASVSEAVADPVAATAWSVATDQSTVPTACWAAPRS